jgi:hypothetical protein
MLAYCALKGSHTVNTLIGQVNQPDNDAEGWSRLRGALKEVFAELGGGKAYLRAERGTFYNPAGERSPGRDRFFLDERQKSSL